jgi:uncharacterized membrane protein YeaQ/YmgE (transglycosylase-associated protein family)
MDKWSVWLVAVLICGLIVGGAFLLLYGRVEVTWFISLLVIGLVIGGLGIYLAEGRGGLALTWTLAAGVIGSLVGGFLVGPVGLMILGPGRAYVGSFIAAAIGAVVLVLLSRFVTRAFA